MSNEAEDNVLFTSTQGAVRVLKINDPATRNSIGPEFFEAASQAISEANSQSGIGAVVIAGAGDFFSSGGNLKMLAQVGQRAPEERRARLELLHDLIRNIRKSPKPVIAAVEGGASGAGMSLALAADLLVAAHDAFFSAAYVKAGLTPDGGLTALLAESLPRQFATQLCLTGERVGAARLHELGVVNSLSEPGQALASAIELGQQLALGPERAIGRILGLCASAPHLDLKEQMDCEAQSMTDSLGDAEAAEGIAAVLARRSTDFVVLRQAESEATNRFGRA